MYAKKPDETEVTEHPVEWARTVFSNDLTKYAFSSILRIYKRMMSNLLDLLLALTLLKRKDMLIDL